MSKIRSYTDSCNLFTLPILVIELLWNFQCYERKSTSALQLPIPKDDIPTEEQEVVSCKYSHTWNSESVAEQVLRLRVSNDGLFQRVDPFLPLLQISRLILRKDQWMSFNHPIAKQIMVSLNWYRNKYKTDIRCVQAISPSVLFSLNCL